MMIPVPDDWRVYRSSWEVLPTFYDAEDLEVIASGWVRNRDGSVSGDWIAHVWAEGRTVEENRAIAVLVAAAPRLRDSLVKLLADVEEAEHFLGRLESADAARSVLDSLVTWGRARG